MFIYLFISLNLLSVILALSSTSWFCLWVAVELSSFFFIPLLSSGDSRMSMIAGWKYYVVQSIGSLMFIMSFVLSMSLGTWTLSLSLMMKMGIPPFSSWVFHVTSNLEWWKIYVLSSVQKGVPLVMALKLMDVEHVSWVVMISCVLGVISMVSNYSLKWMMVVSSIFNISWMMGGVKAGSSELAYYYVIYLYQLWALVLIMVDKGKDLSHFSEKGVMKLGELKLGVCCFMMMGIPPSGMFLPKIDILAKLWQSSDVLLFSTLGIFSSLGFILYLKIFIYGMMVSSSEKQVMSSSSLFVMFLMPLVFSIM